MAMVTLPVKAQNDWQQTEARVSNDCRVVTAMDVM
jgi:hypothetical protein